jgi:hypothetical protein
LKGNPSDEVQKSIDERRTPQKHLTEKRGIWAMVLDGIFLTPRQKPIFELFLISSSNNLVK